jgi:phosphonate transport system substrate-binding protein
MQRKSTVIKSLVLLSVLTAVLFGTNAAPAVPKNWPSKLVMGFLPNEEGDPDKKAALKILQQAMSQDLGIPVEVVICEDYNAVIETMRNKKTQAAYFGPFSYIVAHDRSKAEAICVSAKEGKQENAFYQSFLITNVKTGIKTLNEVKGKKMAFVDPVSTSGNLVPRYMLSKNFNVQPEEIDAKLFSSVQFAGSHNNSLMAVANGSVDVGAVSSSTYDIGIKKGMITTDSVRILIKSDPIPSSPIAVHADLPVDLKKKIKDFFLNFNNDEYNRLRNTVGNRYIEILDANYNTIRAIAKQMRLKEDDLLK